MVWELYGKWLELYERNGNAARVGFMEMRLRFGI